MEEGINEVVITGIHIASYGRDFKGENIGLIDLLEEINKIKGLHRIRLGSIEPTIITEEFVKRLSKLDKICDHFHLSLERWKIMEKIAIISDVHGNITALETVIKDIENRGISKIYCLGDSVLKSCNSDLVIDLLRKKCDVVLKGNCDEAIML